MLYVNLIQVAIVAGFHLFPFRTEKLSPFTPMVLRKWESRSLPFLKRASGFESEALFFILLRTAPLARQQPALPLAQYQGAEPPWGPFFNLLRKCAPSGRLAALRVRVRPRILGLCQYVCTCVNGGASLIQPLKWLATII